MRMITRTLLASVLAIGAGSVAGCDTDQAPAADLGGCAGPAPVCSYYNGPSLCLGNMWWCEGVPRDMARGHD